MDFFDDCCTKIRDFSGIIIIIIKFKIIMIKEMVGIRMLGFL